MNLSKTYIRVPMYKNSASVQMTLDNDFNVPDTKPDIERLIQEKGVLHIRDVKPVKVNVLSGASLLSECCIWGMRAVISSSPLKERYPLKRR